MLICNTKVAIHSQSDSSLFLIERTPCFVQRQSHHFACLQHGTESDRMSVGPMQPTWWEDDTCTYVYIKHDGMVMS